jgi:hypothetical protein
MDGIYLEAERRHGIIKRERVRNFVKGLLMIPVIIVAPVGFIWILGYILN